MKNLLLIIGVLTILTGCFPSKNLDIQEVLIQGETMGTTYNIKIIVESNSTNPQTIKNDIDNALVSINQEMSTYIETSELSRFNQANSSEPVVISKGLERVIAEAIRLGKLSEGSLDVTVGPLVNLWGFGPDYTFENIPTEEVIQQAKAKVGLEHITLNGNKLSKSIDDLYIDLSTIAKGYGVDYIAELLESKGINNYLVEIGGEIRLKGFKDTGELWHVAVEKPISNERSVQQIIVPKNNAVATSGDYRNYFESNGQRFSHIINPKTGKPINHKLVSVTVIHPSSMTADGLSTAMMVMGEDRALKFAQDNNIAAYFISKSDSGFIEESTLEFSQYFK